MRLDHQLLADATEVDLAVVFRGLEYASRHFDDRGRLELSEVFSGAAAALEAERRQRYYAELMRRLSGAELHEVTRWASHNASGESNYTREQRGVWHAIALALDEERTHRAATAHLAGDGAEGELIIEERAAT